MNFLAKRLGDGQKRVRTASHGTVLVSYRSVALDEAKANTQERKVNGGVLIPLDGKPTK